jgi:HK97 family phage portal protein
MQAAAGAAIRLLADDISTLPWGAYRKRKDGGSDPIDSPGWMTNPEGHRFSLPNTHKADAVVSLLSDGNLFVQGIGGAGTIRPDSLYIVPPALVDIEGGNPPAYTITGKDGERVGTFSPDTIAHLPWIRLPGEQRGLNMVEQAKLSTNLELAARAWANAFFDNGATLGGVVLLPREAKKPSKEAVAELRSDIDKRHKGISKSWLLGILTGGATIHDASIKPEEAALAPLWEHVLEEACRLYHVPPHLLASQAGSSVGTNVEQRSIEYVVHAVVPVVERLEELYSRFIPGDDTYIKFNVAALLRGDHKSRADARAVELQNRVITRQEWRDSEDYGKVDPAEGGYLDTPNNRMTNVLIEDASKLIRAGFDPNEALAYVGLDPNIAHLGFSPTTQYDLEGEEAGSTEGTPAQDEVTQ